MITITRSGRGNYTLRTRTAHIHLSRAEVEQLADAALDALAPSTYTTRSDA